MEPQASAVNRLVESVADGSSDVDWDALEADLPTEAERRLVRQLRVLACISAVHRSLPDSGDLGSAGSSAAGSPAFDASISASVDDGRDSSGAIGLDDATSGTEAPRAIRDERAPAAWGHLELREKVGEGTFGEVYRAFDTRLHRDVAVKLLRVGRSAARLVDRVLSEGRGLARIRHPNVVVVHGAEARDGRVGLWMEYIRGATLESLLEMQGTFSAREAALIGQDLCRALAAVHAAGIVHRDIKAQNVMREQGGRIVLMDFGAGQLREASSRGPARLTGTPLYLAPEVLEGGEATVRSDIYSLGVLLYHLVAGGFPLRAGSIDELRAAHAAGRVIRLHDARPDIPDAFAQVVEGALHPDPAQRFASAGQLQGLLGQSTVLVPPGQARAAASPATLARLGAQLSRPVVWTTLVLAGLALLGATAWRTVFSGMQPTPTVVVLPLDHSADVPAPLVEDVARRTADLLGASKLVRVQFVKGAALAAGAEHTGGAPSYVLRGSLAASRAGLQASMQLTKRGAATPAWQRGFAGSGARLPEAIADAVLATLVSHGAAPRARQGSSERAAEFDARGRYALEHGPDRAATAIAMFSQALEVDPNYARARSGLSRAYLTQGCRSRGADALREAELSTSLDPGSAEAFTALGDVRHLCYWDWTAAESAYRTAVSLNPSDEYARTRFAMFLAARDDASGGLAEMLRGRELDSMSATAAGATAQLLYYARRFDEAEREVRRALVLDNQFATGYLALGRILSARGRFVEAARAFAKAEALDSAGFVDYFRAETAAADAGAGRAREAWDFLSERERQRGAMPAEMMAFVYARLGERDKAFEWLDRGVRDHSERLLWLKVDPRADPLRTDPRFDAVLRRLSIP